MAENPDAEAAELINDWVASLRSGRRSHETGKGFADVVDFQYI
jgi:hypothetical protein